MPYDFVFLLIIGINNLEEQILSSCGHSNIKTRELNTELPDQYSFSLSAGRFSTLSVGIILS